MKSDVRGTYSPVTKNIAISTSDPAPHSVALHELQHKVQDIEGFSPGGSWQRAEQVKQAAREKLPGIHHRLVEIAGEVREMQARGDWQDVARLRKTQDELVRYRESLMQDALADPTKIYRGFPGEVEARIVEARRDFTPEQRRNEPPWKTEH